MHSVVHFVKEQLADVVIVDFEVDSYFVDYFVTVVRADAFVVFLDFVLLL